MYAAQDIPQGTFVCQYVGQYVTAAVARRQLDEYDKGTDRGHALLVSETYCDETSTHALQLFLLDDIGQSLAKAHRGIMM